MYGSRASRAAQMLDTEIRCSSGSSPSGNCSIVVRRSPSSAGHFSASEWSVRSTWPGSSAFAAFSLIQLASSLTRNC
jgi:hypothetical protein